MYSLMIRCSNFEAFDVPSEGRLRLHLLSKFVDDFSLLSRLLLAPHGLERSG